MPTTRVYQDTDASAPVVDGTWTTLESLLDGCLVNGYGARTAAGWSKPFSGASKAAYRSGAGLQYYYRLADAGGSTLTLSGYTSMTDVDTGSGQWGHGAAFQWVTSGGTHKWLVVADELTAYVFVETSAASGKYYWMAFGDFYSFAGSTDTGRALVLHSSNLLSRTLSDSNVSSSHVRAYAAKSLDGSTTSMLLAATGDTVKGDGDGASFTYMRGVIPFPNPAGSNALLAPIYLSDTSGSGYRAIRGKARGLWHWLHPVGAVADRDVFSGTGSFAGKSFIALNELTFSAVSPPAGVAILETSSTWLTN